MNGRSEGSAPFILWARRYNPPLRRDGRADEGGSLENC